MFYLDQRIISKYLKIGFEEFEHRISIGLCQSKFYKPSVWRKAKAAMDEVLVPLNLVFAFDFGRGKGKYDTFRNGGWLGSEELAQAAWMVLNFLNGNELIVPKVSDGVYAAQNQIIINDLALKLKDQVATA